MHNTLFGKKEQTQPNVTVALEPVYSVLTTISLLTLSDSAAQVESRIADMAASLTQDQEKANTVIFESFSTVTRIELNVDGETVYQLHGWQAHHELICEALRLEHLGDEIGEAVGLALDPYTLSILLAVK